MLLQRALSNKQYTVAELFCGCGGFSHGFARTGRFSVVLGNDIKPAALRTFQYNHRNHITGQSPAIITGDIRQVPIETIVTTLERQGVKEGELDCLIGGPPCQGFSQMRRTEERDGSKIVKFKGYNRLDQDPRNDLVLRFLEIAAVLQPKVILIENVEQMLRHHHNGVAGGLAENIHAILREIGYDVDVTTLNAADFGVPQLRERVVFMASRIGEIKFPSPTYTDPLFDKCSRSAWATVEDAIRDLPSPPLSPTDELGNTNLDSYPQVELSSFAAMMRSSSAFPYNHLTRRYSPSIMRIIAEMQPGETWDHASERMRHHYKPIVDAAMLPDENLAQTISRLGKANEIVPAFYRQYYWSAYTRLAWDRPALTITANANFLGSGRFTHPVENRGITMREAARLQSFEDDFRFLTTAQGENTGNISVGLDMIGEAVPPLLAEALAQQIVSVLDGTKIVTDPVVNEHNLSLAV